LSKLNYAELFLKKMYRFLSEKSINITVKIQTISSRETGNNIALVMDAKVNARQTNR